MYPETFLALHVVAMLSLLAWVTFRSEWRRRRVERDVSEDRVFRCGDCGLVYTDDAEVDRSRCPQCGRTNGPFEF